MPTISDLYRQPPDALTPALANLTRAFMSGPSQSETDFLRARTDAARARANAARAMAEKTRLEIQAAADRKNAIGSLPDLYRNLFVAPPEPVRSNSFEYMDAAPPAIDLGERRRQGLGDFARAGTSAGLDPQNIADLYRFLAANSGLPNSDLRNALIGSGDFNKSIADAFAFENLSTDDKRTSLLGQPAFGANESQIKAEILDNLSSGNQRIEALGQAAYGPSESQARGAAFRLLDSSKQSSAVGPTREETIGTRLDENFNDLDDLSASQREVLGAEPSPVSATPRNYILPDGGRGTTLDGVTDASTGDKLPEGTQVYTNVGSDTPTPIKVMEQKTEIAVKRFKSLVGYTRKLAKDNPMNFGLPGFVKGVVQDASALAQGVSQSLGYENADEALAEVRGEAAANSDLSDETMKRLFDPNLPKLQSAASLLLYAAASALAGQENRSVSDADIKRMETVAGSPQSWFTSQEKYLATLDALDQMVNVLGAEEESGDSPTGGVTHKYVPGRGIVPIGE